MKTQEQSGIGIDSRSSIEQKKVLAPEGVDSFTTESEFLTTDEAAEFLRISVGSLRNMTSNGDIPFYKLGHRNRYLREDLRKLLLTNQRGGFYGY